MTLKEKIEEAITCVLFGLFLCGLMFGASISDAIDQTIIESRQQ